jgi:hypothetical protein
VSKFLVLLFILSISLFSSPTIYGPTGVIEMPSAESIAYKQVNMAIDYALGNNSSDDADGSGDDAQLFYKFNLGSFENWELGILGGSFLDEGVYVNMKYFLMSNQEEHPLSIAAGIERLGSKKDLSTYLVTSKRFSGGLHGHFGFKAFFQNKLTAAAMIGIEYFSDEKISFLADILGGRNENYVLNAGTKIFIDSDIAIRLSLIDITKARPAKETLYTVGISVSKYI